MAHLFDKREKEYTQWLRFNPHGYVLTTTRKLSLEHMVLHKSQCRMISRHMANMATGAFTERKFVKICAEDTTQLLVWIKNQGGHGFTKHCQICKPPSDYKPLDEFTMLNEFDVQVRSALRDSAEARRARLKHAKRVPDTRMVETIVYVRNPDVVAEVLERARGHCEKCSKPAPFFRATDQSPYLEVHHRKRLAEGGLDTVENAMALCPNCHREAHFG